jgi:guanylate kinase
LGREFDSTPRSGARGPAGGIAVVGPCGAGKSTLVDGLRRVGIAARQIAQEHSHVTNLWRHGAADAILVYLDATFSTCTERKRFDWPEDDYREQIRRLARARRECDVYLATDGLTPAAVLDRVVQAVHPSASGRVARSP